MTAAVLLNLGAPDVTAPALSSPASSDLKNTTVDLGVTTDEGNGTLYWAIRTGSTPLDESDIQTGTGAVSNGNQPVSSSGVQVLNDVGSLAPGTSYYADFVHTDASSNDSNVVSTAQFTTAAINYPEFSSASVAANGTALSIVFDENANVGTGGNGGFTVSPSGGAATLSYVSGDGTSTLVYTLSRTLGVGETLTISYVQPGNGIEDDEGNDLASFSNQPVTNNSTQDVTEPTLISAVVVNGDELHMSFSEVVSVGAGGNGGFLPTMNGGSATLAYASGDGSTLLVYDFSRTIGATETGTFAYTQPGNGIEDGAGNDLASFSGITVSNVSLQHKRATVEHNATSLEHNVVSLRHKRAAVEHNN